MAYAIGVCGLKLRVSAYLRTHETHALNEAGRGRSWSAVFTTSFTTGFTTSFTTSFTASLKRGPQLVLALLEMRRAFDRLGLQGLHPRESP